MGCEISVSLTLVFPCHHAISTSTVFGTLYKIMTDEDTNLDTI